MLVVVFPREGYGNGLVSLGEIHLSITDSFLLFLNSSVLNLGEPNKVLPIVLFKFLRFYSSHSLLVKGITDLFRGNYF